MHFVHSTLRSGLVSWLKKLNYEHAVLIDQTYVAYLLGQKELTALEIINKAQL